MKHVSEWMTRHGRIVLAMTGQRNPWGEGGEPKGEPDAAPEHASDGATPDGGGPESGTGGEAQGPRNPWLPSPERLPRRSSGFEDIFRSRKDDTRGGGGGSGGGRGPLFRLPRRAGGKSWAPLLIAGVLGIWVLATSAHELDSTEQGIVTTFGKYTRTVGPGVSFTLPWPIEDVTVVDVTSIRRESIPEGEAEKLMLTSDQNLVDLSYLVRWNIRDLKLYTFQLEDPDSAVRDVAEAAMRASVAEVKLNDVMGGIGRAEIEESVRKRMQAVLDAYRSGVLIQGVDIKKADPPSQVNDAFQQVSAAEQGANRDISRAQGFAQQVIARAQGDAAAFDKVYAQYKLAPEVTRRRMYYETMERVLSNNDKVIVEGNTTSYLPLPQVKHPAAQDADSSQEQGQ